MPRSTPRNCEAERPCRSRRWGSSHRGCTTEPALQLAQEILNHPSLVFTGLQAYSVRASHLREDEGRVEYTANALEGALQTRELLEANGISTPAITGGSTGNYTAEAVLPYVTELQAGSYALMDVAYRRLAIDFSNALTVLGTVISANHPDRVTVDAGPVPSPSPSPAAPGESRSPWYRQPRPPRFRGSPSAPSRAR